MRVQAVIEITSSGDGRLPARLLTEAYRASDCGVIILVLNGVTPVAVDQLLDHVVASLPLSIPGVLYVDAGDEAAVDRALHRTGIVFAATARLRRRTRPQGPAMECAMVLPVDLADAWLARRYERRRSSARPVPVMAVDEAAARASAIARETAPVPLPA